MQNAQWVKPLWPGDIPPGTRAHWNFETEEWEFLPLEQVVEPTPTPTPAQTDPQA